MTHYATFPELLENDPVAKEFKIVASSRGAANWKKQIVVAIRSAAGNDDVKTLDECFARVDAGEFNVRLHDSGLVSIEYGAGDNSFGAVFCGGLLFARINDGDLIWEKAS